MASRGKALDDKVPTDPVVSDRVASESVELGRRLAATRALTLALAEPLSDADATIQPNPDASPAKWHLAHTSWFFETFVLRDHVPGHRPFDERFAFLFNSYYEGEGERHPRPRRGMLSRPTLDEVRRWRAKVDAELAGALPVLSAEGLELVELGIQHEQQHQELLLTDILATFAENPLEPAFGEIAAPPPAALPESMRFIAASAGQVMVGAGDDGFAFDCERPRHAALLHPHALADRPVSNGEWAQFIADGGYSTPTLWLSEGWDWRCREAIEAPLYWRRGEDGWSRFTLAGRQPLAAADPVCHVSLYEADAFARWADARLPREEEWEAAAGGADPGGGNQLDRAGAVAPRPTPTGSGHRALFGDVWEWTMSSFSPYPGFAPAGGAVGEYNGKFMCGQFVLKGGSCATPRGHMRSSYRNFFPPAARWQFSGVRLARDA